MDVELVNLQYGDCKEEIFNAYQQTGIAVKSVNEIDTFTNIDHLASLIACCDRIITIDNSTVHLSASMETNRFTIAVYHGLALGRRREKSNLVRQSCCAQSPIWHSFKRLH